MLMRKNFVVALNIIKVGFITRSSSVLVRNSPLVFDLIWSLFRLGFFRNISYIRSSNQLKITLKYIRRQPVLQNINILYSTRRPIFCTLWKLKRCFKNKMVLVPTTAGIITRSECLARGIGGVLVASSN